MADELAEVLNKDCFCIAVNREALHNSLEEHLRESGLPERLLDENSHLFADSPVFLQQGHLQEMEQLIRAVEKVTRNRAYRDEVIGFFGGRTRFEDVAIELIEMFKEEFQSQCPGKTLRRIAIVDNEPSAQFLYPEFLLFQSLFERHGIEAIIADPKDFTIEEHTLCIGEQKIDLVYNRLTDFYLETPDSACLLEAYHNEIAVFTPSPYIYSLYADKRNLTLLSDSSRLEGFGVEKEAIAALSNSLPWAYSPSL